MYWSNTLRAARVLQARVYAVVPQAFFPIRVGNSEMPHLDLLHLSVVCLRRYGLHAVAFKVTRAFFK